MNKNLHGFTVIELMLVMAIIAIVSTVSFASFSGSITRGRDTTRKSDLQQLRKALETFKNQFGVYPDSDTNKKMLGCMDSPPADPKAPSFIPCPASNGGFRYYVNGEEENSLTKFPVDPAVNRTYLYVYTPSSYGGSVFTPESYALYAALENTQDKDVKQLNGAPDPDGWGFDCGSVRCNYKVTDQGLVLE